MTPQTPQADTAWSIRYVRARSKAEAIEKVHRGEVELMQWRRELARSASPALSGDLPSVENVDYFVIVTKVNARLLRGDEAVYFDPGPPETERKETR